MFGLVTAALTRAIRQLACDIESKPLRKSRPRVVRLVLKKKRKQQQQQQQENHHMANWSSVLN